MPPKLSQLTSSLTRFLVKGGRGLWYQFERRREPMDFRVKIVSAMTRQVKQTLTPNVAVRIYSEAQKAETLTARIKRLIAEAFRPITTFLTTDDVNKYLRWSAVQGGQSALSMMGVRAEFNLRNGLFLGTLAKRGSWLLKNIDQTTLEALQEQVVDAIKEGLTATEIQASITARFEDDINPYRAEMITRTEFAHAATKAQRKTFEKSGIKRWTWSQPPGDEDDECTDNDGESVAIGEPFPSGDTEPPLHPNCKCAVVPVPPEDFDPEGAWLGD